MLLRSEFLKVLSRSIFNHREGSVNTERLLPFRRVEEFLWMQYDCGSCWHCGAQISTDKKSIQYNSDKVVPDVYKRFQNSDKGESYKMMNRLHLTLMCVECHCANYCSIKCQQKNFKMVHQFTCPMFAATWIYGDWWTRLYSDTFKSFHRETHYTNNGGGGDCEMISLDKSGNIFNVACRTGLFPALLRSLSRMKYCNANINIDDNGSGGGGSGSNDDNDDSSNNNIGSKGNNKIAMQKKTKGCKSETGEQKPQELENHNGVEKKKKKPRKRKKKKKTNQSDGVASAAAACATTDKNTNSSNSNTSVSNYHHHDGDENDKISKHSTVTQNTPTRVYDTSITRTVYKTINDLQGIDMILRRDLSGVQLMGCLYKEERKRCDLETLLKHLIPDKNIVKCFTPENN
jgi:hypothetical protein